MFVRENAYRNGKGVARTGWRAAAALAALAAFALVLAAPVTIDPDGGGPGSFGWNSALAKGQGGGNGGGNGGGGNGGGGNGGGADGGGNGGGGNAGGGNAGGKDSTASRGDNGGGGRIVNAPVAEPTVSIAQFTSAIRKRYPADALTSFDDPHRSVSFFSELKQMKGRTVTHRWTFGGKVRFESSFNIRADSWRAWSTQLLPTDLAGDWTVEIVDGDGTVLERKILAYRPAGSQIATN